MESGGESIYTFTFPKNIAALAGHETIGIKQMKAGASLELLRKYPDDQAGYLKAKVSGAIAALDGKPVGYIEAVSFYEKMPSKVSDLIDRAYQSVNLPSEEDVADFLSSVTVS